MSEVSRLSLQTQGEELAKILAVTNNVRTFAARMAQGPCVALTIMGEDAIDRQVAALAASVVELNG